MSLGLAINYAMGQTPRTNPRAPQTSSYGRPIAIVYGTCRVSGVIILSGWYMSQKVSGLLGVFANGMVQVALCEGPISEVLSLWLGQVQYTPAGLGIDTIQTGARSQAPWATLTASFPNYALGYGGTAVACESAAWTFKADGELSAATWEVSGLYTTAGAGAQNVSPATIIADLLTNAEYGLGWDTAKLDGYAVVGSKPVAFTTGVDGTADTSFFSLCEVGGFGMALALEEQRPVREIIEELAAATDSVCVWSEGTLKMRPRAGWTHTIGAYTFDGAAALVPAYDLGLSSSGADFLADPAEAPISVERVPTKSPARTCPAPSWWSPSTPTTPTSRTARPTRSTWRRTASARPPRRACGPSSRRATPTTWRTSWRAGASSSGTSTASGSAGSTPCWSRATSSR
jgi:hypothetical protein